MDNIDTLADFRRQSQMPISASEMLLTRPDYNDALSKQAMDYVMIDPTWVGGISETARIAHLHKPTTYQFQCTTALVR